jgi:hypothetical protein
MLAIAVALLGLSEGTLAPAARDADWTGPRAADAAWVATRTWDDYGSTAASCPSEGRRMPRSRLRTGDTAALDLRPPGLAPGVGIRLEAAPVVGLARLPVPRLQELRI